MKLETPKLKFLSVTTSISLKTIKWGEAPMLALETVWLHNNKGLDDTSFGPLDAFPFPHVKHLSLNNSSITIATLNEIVQYCPKMVLVRFFFVHHVAFFHAQKKSHVRFGTTCPKTRSLVGETTLYLSLRVTLMRTKVDLARIKPIKNTERRKIVQQLTGQKKITINHADEPKPPSTGSLWLKARDIARHELHAPSWLPFAKETAKY